MAIDINIESQVSQTITDGVTDKAPSENAVFDALANKVDKETGKGLSEEDFTMAEKNKLAGIEAGAEVNVNADWNATSGDTQILNKPTIPSVTDFVPYTGAVADVDLGTHKLTAHNLVVNHPSGSGDAATITKGGSGEALKVVKSSGSGNAASITGGVTLLEELNLTTKLADAEIASAATWNAKLGGAVSIGQVAFGTAAGVIGGDAGLFWDNVNKRLSVGAISSFAWSNTRLEVRDQMRIFDSSSSSFGLRFGFNSNIPFLQGFRETIGVVNLQLQPLGGNVGIGTTSPSARLHVQAPGALSTDIAFRVRNSADTANFAEFNGNGAYFLSSNGGALDNAFSRITDGRMFMAKSGINFIELNATNGQNRLFFSSNGLEISTGSVQTNISMTSTSFRFYQNTVQLSAALQVGSGTNALLIQNGTAPSANRIDHHWYYSADIVAGNAAPHFRTENGSVIKLYKQDLPTNPTNAEIATFLSNLGMANLI
jgi:hypothetical protein